MVPARVSAIQTTGTWAAPLEQAEPIEVVPSTKQKSIEEAEVEYGDGPYSLPPISLFPVAKESAHDEASHEQGKQRALTLEHKLDRFGIKGKSDLNYPRPSRHAF